MTEKLKKKILHRVKEMLDDPTCMVTCYPEKSQSIDVTDHHADTTDSENLPELPGTLRIETSTIPSCGKDQ